MIQVNGIHQSYCKRGQRKILEDISLTIKENAITALVGANGAGKSTLLGVMTNLIEAQRGEVLLEGKNIRKMRTYELAKKIAFLRQSQQVSLGITVNDLVEFGRFPHSGGRLNEADKIKVEEAISHMNLSDLIHRNLNELSGGQRQRAFIAMILAQDTPYIFLDEPLNNLDIKYSVEMMKIIKMMVEDLGKTVIVVLHDINFASAYADHIIAMKEGKVILEGRPHQVITKATLDDVYDHDFNIVTHGDKNICLYFHQETDQKQKSMKH